MTIWQRPDRGHLGISYITLLGEQRANLPRIILSPTAAAKMEAMVACCNMECSWVATSDRIERGYRIDDVFVPPQLCSMGSTIFRELSLLAPFMGEDGRISREHFPLIERMHVWGHSHHRMGVFASTTDDDQAYAFLDQMSDYFIRLICNKYNEMYATLYQIDKGIAVHHPIIEHEDAAASQEAWASFPFDDWAMDELRRNVHPVYYEVEEGDEGGIDWNIDLHVGRQTIEELEQDDV